MILLKGLTNPPDSGIMNESGHSNGKTGDTDGMTIITDIKPIDFNDKEAVMKEIESFAARYAYADVEHALEISPDGNAYSLTGTKQNVNSELIGKDALSGSISIHNHPLEIGEIKADSFSLQDLIFSAENRQGKQYLVSGERYDAFGFSNYYTSDEIFNAWKKAYYELLMQSSKGYDVIINENEQILKILDKQLEGFKFENL